METAPVVHMLLLSCDGRSSSIVDNLRREVYRNPFFEPGYVENRPLELFVVVTFVPSKVHRQTFSVCIYVIQNSTALVCFGKIAYMWCSIMLKELQ